MIVISDRILRQAGLTLAEAKALLSPADAELIVHIRQELDPFSSPAIESLDGAHDPDSDPPDPPAARLSGDLNRRPTAPLVPQASPAAEGKPTDSRSAAPAIEDHGYSLGTAAKLAAMHDMTLTEAGGLYTLRHPVWGQQHYTSLAQAVAAVKQFARWAATIEQPLDEDNRSFTK